MVDTPEARRRTGAMRMPKDRSCGAGLPDTTRHWKSSRRRRGARSTPRSDPGSIEEFVYARWCRSGGRAVAMTQDRSAAIRSAAPLKARAGNRSAWRPAVGLPHGYGALSLVVGQRELAAGQPDEARCFATRLAAREVLRSGETRRKRASQTRAQQWDDRLPRAICYGPLAIAVMAGPGWRGDCCCSRRNPAGAAAVMTKINGRR